MVGRTVLLCSLAANTLAAQVARDSARLADLVVTAHRDSVPARLRPSAADLMTGSELTKRRIHSLADGLRLLAGTTIVATGAPGGIGSSFFRGVNSNQTLLMVDGIRMTDANTLAQAFIGAFETGATDRLEVVRGPQGTVYGGGAIGGVIAIHPDRPTGDAVTATVEAGRFASYRGRVSATIARPRWSAALTAGATDSRNERPNNETDGRSQALAISWRPTQWLEAGFTARGHQSSYRSPGDIRSSNTTPVGLTTFDHLLTTANAIARLTPRWTSRLTVGGQRYFLEGTSRYNGGPEFVSRLATDRAVVDWNHRLEVSARLRAVAGLTMDWANVADGDIRRDERQRAGYLELTLEPVDNVVISTGSRWDRYDSYGETVTGRLALGYFVAGSRTKLRGTIGTGFLPPSLTARYGGPFQRANPALDAERSTGWDLGVDQFLARDRAVVSVSYFANSLRQLIGFESAPFPELGRAVNIDRARTSGLELSGRAVLGAIDLRASYTLLDAKDRSGGNDTRLIRRPRHAVGLDLAWSGHRVRGGLSARGAFDRVDDDFNAFPASRVDPGDYLDLRARASWHLGGQVSLEGRLDNLGNARYEEVYGFPALGRRVSMGLVVDWPR